MVPYLNVAAPAALVATVPPTKAPVNVGDGRIRPARVPQRFVERGERDARLHAHVVDADELDAVQP